MDNDIFDEVIQALREDEKFEEAIVELVKRYFVDEQGGKHDDEQTRQDGYSQRKANR